MTKVSVIITTCNYEKYLKKAVESVLNQSFKDFELIIVDDGSTDNTKEILKEYESKEKIRIISHPENRGLIVSSIEAINASKGEYIIRLDADDYFDENALLVLSTFLDDHPDVALVYPDYFQISEDGKILDYTRLLKIGEDTKVLDIPCNGAGTMFRRSSYDAVGGYNPNVRYQDGYDLWIKFINRFKVGNVNIPLFYYRKHSESITSQPEKLLKARRHIKDTFLKERLKGKKLKILGIIPARVHDYCDYLAIRDLNGKPLITYTIESALKTELLDKVIFTTEDEKIAEVASRYGVEVILRPEELARPKTSTTPTVLYVLDRLKKSGYAPDVVVLLYTNSPLKNEEHIVEAINTLLIFGTDSVISVCEDLKFHYKHAIDGLQPLFEKRLLRLEKEVLYEETGAIYVSWTNVITTENFLGEKIGHIVMTPEESVHIDSEFDFWLAEQILRRSSHNGQI